MTDVAMNEVPAGGVDTGVPSDDPPPIADEDASKDNMSTNLDDSSSKTNDETADAAEDSPAETAEAAGTNPADDSSKEKTNGDDDDDEDEPPPGATPDDLLLKAMSHKEDGNAHFKSGDYTSATRSYRRGTNALKNLNVNNTGDDQVKQLLITLQTNLSMVCFKQNKHKMSRDVATKAIEIDALNVKALYRRAVAHRALGDVDAARIDLRTALKSEPNNKTIKKELLSVKKVIDDRKTKEKARLQKAFSSGGSSLLYSDKEEEEKRREREAKEKERLEKELLEKRKKEWEDECVKRMASDPPQEAISFEEWDKERKQAEEEEEKARKKAKKEEEDRKREEQRKARELQKAANPNNVTNDDSDDDELTEKELAMLRGYKKTSDGRTTSYFNREQTEHEKQLIGCIKPKRLDEVSASSPSPTASATSAAGGGPSVWNAAGTTWEEKDTTDWCKKTLEKCLLDTTVAYHSETSSEGNTYVAIVTKVKDLTGDASVAIAGGKKRYIYDFHANVEYEVRDEADEVIAKGDLKLPEIHSANTSADNEEELEVEILAWKEGPKPPANAGDTYVVQDCTECRKMLVSDVRKSVLKFVELFNANY